MTKKGMRISIDIRNDIPPTIALECLKQVIAEGRVSCDGKMYCYATTFDTSVGNVWVAARPYRKTDCFIIFKNEMPKELE